MKKFTKENWFKLVILFLFLLAISFIFLYENKQQEIERQTQINNFNTSCQKLASQKKDEIKKDKPNLYIGVYEYRYNLIHNACILTYTGSYLGDSIGAIFGHNIFEIDNLSTGEIIMHEQVDPGDFYRKANEKFNTLKKEYLNNTELIK